MAAAGFRPVPAEDHAAEKLRVGDGPTKWSRSGIPAGRTRAEAEAAWAKAEQEAADRAIPGLEAQGLVPAVVIPDSDEALAKAALHAVAVIALAPMKGVRNKARALDVLLSFTKPKPAHKVIAKIGAVEEWLKSLRQAEPAAASAAV
jgi:hypothetical protein